MTSLKKILAAAMLAIAFGSLVSCRIFVVRKAPPGQVKQVTGSKSAGKTNTAPVVSGSKKPKSGK